jgi:hypothetical protein
MSIVVKVGDRRAQFDVDGMLENLNNTTHDELAVLFWSKYSPWTATNVESKNRRRSTRSTTTAMPIAILPVAASVVMAYGSGVQASNNRSTARPPGRASPRVRSRVGDEQPESAWTRRRSSIGTGSSGSGMTHVDNQGRRDTKDVPDYEKFTAIQKEFWDNCTSSFLFGM